MDMKRNMPGAIAVAALALSPLPAAAAGVCGPIPSGWQSARDDLSRPVNVLILYDKPPQPPPMTPMPPKPPSWNGSPVKPEQVREYLGITTQMAAPRPVFVLAVSPDADCTEVEQYRRMIKEVLGCAPGECIEVDL